MDKELKLNCPFCSVPEVYIRRITNTFWNKWIVRCRYCGAFDTVFTRWGALQKWNKMLEREYKFKIERNENV